MTGASVAEGTRERSPVPHRLQSPSEGRKVVVPKASEDLAGGLAEQRGSRERDQVTGAAWVGDAGERSGSEGRLEHGLAHLPAPRVGKRIPDGEDGEQA